MRSLVLNGTPGSLAPTMRNLRLLAVQLNFSLATLARPDGVCFIIAESQLLKHQPIIGGRSRQHAPPLTAIDSCPD